ncbi:unnamed protein product [Phytomonas sp. Hart1]|nr:unnamed protein product [Phytomonas sp. Hart1]|eukprot:CCW69039.1 unnamed protein product [Phytomonas sp. isolate Hart1]
MASVEQERAWALSLPPSDTGEGERGVLFDLRAAARGAVSALPGEEEPAQSTGGVEGGGGVVGAAYAHGASLYQASTLLHMATFPFQRGISWRTECFLRGERQIDAESGCGVKADTPHLYTLVLRKNAAGRQAITTSERDCWWWACYDDRWPRSPVWWKRVEVGHEGESSEGETGLKREAGVEPTHEAAKGSEEYDEKNLQGTVHKSGKGVNFSHEAHHCLVQGAPSRAFIESLGSNGFAFATLSHHKEHYHNGNGKICGRAHALSSLLDLHTVQKHYDGQEWAYHHPSLIPYASNFMGDSFSSTCDTMKSRVEGGVLKSMIYFEGVLNLLYSS